MRKDARLVLERAVFLFDGDCGICLRAAEFARRIDERRAFQFVPHQSLSEEMLTSVGLSRKQCQRRVYLISPTGRIRGGAFAINAFLLAYPPWRYLVIVIMLVPPLLLLELIGYALIARFRHRISRRLGLQQCGIPESGPRH